MKIFLGLLIALATILLGLSYGVMSMSPPEYDMARGAAVGAAIAAMLAYLMWLFVTYEPLLIRIGVGALTALVMFVLLPGWLSWIEHVDARNTAAAIAANNAHRMTGILKPSEVLVSGSKVSRRMEIGDSGSMLQFGGPNGEPLLTFFDGSNLTIEVIGESLKVSTILRDQTGDIVAELQRNQWKIALPPKTWDRNFTNNALEVINPQGDVALQIQILPDRIRLQGEWWKDKIYGARVVKSNDPAHPGGTLALFGPGFGPKDAPQIKRLFVYPSEFHLGEMSK